MNDNDPEPDRHKGCRVVILAALLAWVVIFTLAKACWPG